MDSLFLVVSRVDRLWRGVKAWHLGLEGQQRVVVLDPYREQTTVRHRTWFLIMVVDFFLSQHKLDSLCVPFS